MFVKFDILNIMVYQEGNGSWVQELGIPIDSVEDHNWACAWYSCESLVDWLRCMRTNPSRPGIMLMLDTTWPSSSCHGSCQQFLVGSVVQLFHLPAPCRVAFSRRLEVWASRSYNWNMWMDIVHLPIQFSYLYHPSYPPQTSHLSWELPYILIIICLNSLRWTCMSNEEGAFQVSMGYGAATYGIINSASCVGHWWLFAPRSCNYSNK